jgi:hypothetical protein
LSAEGRNVAAVPAREFPSGPLIGCSLAEVSHWHAAAPRWVDQEMILSLWPEPHRVR